MVVPPFLAVGAPCCRSSEERRGDHLRGESSSSSCDSTRVGVRSQGQHPLRVHRSRTVEASTTGKNGMYGRE
uniref:Uncharacterized protein n=1 Tax=Phyllostachys edulis TaxID=38705 RepID=D3IVU1_PHYED|nr:hypothetical protein [Phyllostachys edulis]